MRHLWRGLLWGFLLNICFSIILPLKPGLGYILLRHGLSVVFATLIIISLVHERRYRKNIQGE